MIKVLVIGAGPAGIMAACTAAKNGHDVTLLERNSKIGRKLMITGKGRCNVTNALYDEKEFIDNVPINGRFLFSAMSQFMPTDTMDLFEALGVPLKIERGNRVFPESDKSVDIVDALLRYLKDCGVKLVFGARVNEIYTERSEEGRAFVTGVVCENGRRFSCDRLVLATGGASYPATGSTGDGYDLSRTLGHNVTDLSPSLVPIESSDSTCKELQGLSLKNVAIKIVDNKSGKPIYSDFGEMLFTHFGVSGPMILSASSHMRTIIDGQYSLHIDLKPALSEEKLDYRIQRDFLEQPNKDFQNALSSLLPSKLIPIIVERSGVEPTKKVNQITKLERHALVFALKNLIIPLSKFRPIEEAIVTSGGIDIKEINPKTMESKLVSGLFFAGELIDIDAYTGGFNIQIAFSTGYLAGLNL